MAFLKKIPSSFTDAELVAQYKQHAELSVLGDLYQRYMELIYGVCLKYLKNPDDAQDAVMAVFEELVTKLKQHEVSAFKSWVYTVAKNHCLMRLRSKKRTQPTALKEEFMQSDALGHLEEVMIREDNLQQLEYCLGQLSANQRTAIEAFYLKQKCYQEIAAETGIEWSRVRSFIQNGRRNLKICMESHKAQTAV